MLLINTSYDKLEYTVKGQLRPELFERIEQAKLRTIEKRQEQRIEIEDQTFLVGDTGLGRHYPYRLHTGALGVQIGLRKPKGRDPWGIRVAVRGICLAINGLDGAFAEATRLVELLIDPDGSGDAVIGRVDFAIDVLDPSFVLDPKSFVCHGRTKARAHADIPVALDWRADRITGVTIGKLPNAQVTIYDKRLEQVEKRGRLWWSIWDRALERRGLPPLDPQDREKSQIWRVEFRVGKNRLRDAHIRRFEELQARLPDLLLQMARRTRCTIPQQDRNRSRWPLAPIWALVIETLESRQVTVSTVRPHVLEAILRTQMIEQLDMQAEGCLRSLAVAKGVAPEDYPSFATKRGYFYAENARRDPERTREKMEKAKERQTFR